MNRMSSLPFAEFCGLVAQLSEGYGGGRPAIMGSAFHAQCADSPDAPLWRMKLTEDERSDIDEWYAPEPRTSIGGLKMGYLDGERELEVGLTHDGQFCTADDPRLMSLGHVDWCQVVPAEDCVYVTDIKRSLWTVGDGPRSLQLQAYGFALAQRYGVGSYQPAIWGAVEGEYLIGERVSVADGSWEAVEAWGRIEHAATNRGEAVTGAHCLGCYVRAHCPEHLLPAGLAALETADPELRARVAHAIATFSDGGPVTTAKDALAVLILSKGLEDLADKLKEAGKAYALNHGLHDPASGKVYRRLTVKGRESSVSVAELRRLMGANAERLIKRSADYGRWQWVKP